MNRIVQGVWIFSRILEKIDKNLIKYFLTHSKTFRIVQGVFLRILFGYLDQMDRLNEKLSIFCRKTKRGKVVVAQKQSLVLVDRAVQSLRGQPSLQNQ